MVAECFLGKIEVEYDAYVQITEKIKFQNKKRWTGPSGLDFARHPTGLPSSPHPYCKNPHPLSVKYSQYVLEYHNGNIQYIRGAGGVNIFLGGIA